MTAKKKPAVIVISQYLDIYLKWAGVLAQQLTMRNLTEVYDITRGNHSRTHCLVSFMVSGTSMNAVKYSIRVTPEMLLIIDTSVGQFPETWKAPAIIRGLDPVYCVAVYGSVMEEKLLRQAGAQVCINRNKVEGPGSIEEFRLTLLKLTHG